MITIKDIQEGSHVWFAQHRYLVLEVCPRLFIAKRFRDGVTRTFPESEFKSVDLEKLCAASVFVAVDAHGEPYIYLGSLRGMVVEHGIVWRRLKASMWIGECLFRGV